MTQNTQPLMLTAGVAVWRIWQKSTDIVPAWMAGHSLGEYSALVCAGSIHFRDAVGLVAKRAEFMQNAVPKGVGAMAAILGLKDPQVVSLCSEVAAGEVVAPVNFNSPGQIVIAGHATAVARAIQQAKEMGAKRAVILPVSVPSHCALMTDAASELEKVLEDIAVEIPAIPVVHNVDVGTHAAPEVIRRILVSQLSNPVRWSDSVKFLSEQGVTRFIECGPGKVLTGLNKRIARSCVAIPMYDPQSLENALEDI